MYKTRVDARFDKESGISTAHLITPEGIFHGVAMCAPDDMEYISSQFGCEIAEIRAWISYYKYLKQLSRAKYEVCSHLLKTTPKNVKSSEQIRRERDKWAKDCADLKDSIHKMSDEIGGLIKQRDEFIDKVYKHPTIKKTRFEPLENLIGRSKKENSI